MGRSFKTLGIVLTALSILATGALLQGPLASDRDDSRTERSDLNLSRDDRGELWEDDSHQALRDRHRESEFEAEKARERYEERNRDKESLREQDLKREREDRMRDHDDIRERSHERDLERESLHERERDDD